MGDGGPRPVSGLRRKAVLATLALHDGETVSTDRLVDVVWGETAPPTAVNTLQSHVSHLRSVLGCKAAILARPPGYVLDLGDDGTDVQLAQRLLRQGTQSADPARGGYARSGRFDDAFPRFHHALRLLETIGGYSSSQVTAHSGLTWIAERQERHADMLSHSLQALELSRAAGDRPLQIMSLNDAGYSHAQLGNYQQAIAYCERALAGSQEMGERNWEAATWHSLGYIYLQLGDHQRAVSCYERSLDLCRELADRFNEADTLEHLGGVHQSAGDIGAAHWAWTQAVRIFEEIDHPGGDRVRAKLRNRDDWAASDGVVSQALDRRAESLA
jgi:tetratricopeptide (TPR) repeat protein